MSVSSESREEKAGFWKNISLCKKLLLGFSSVLLILVFVSSLGVFNFMKTGDGMQEFAETVEEATLISSIERDFLKMQLHVTNFINAADIEEGQRAKKYGKTLLEDIQQARSLLSAHNQDTKSIDIIEKDITIFLKDFEKAEYLSNDFRHLMKDKLVPEGILLEENLKKVVADLQETEGENITTRAALALNHVVKARFYTSIALGRENKDMVNKAKEELKTLQEEITLLRSEVHSEEDQRLLSEMMPLIEDYQILTAKILDEKAQIETLVKGEMTEVAQELSSETKMLLDTAVERENAIKAETGSLIKLAEFEMIVAAGLGIVIGVTLSILIGRLLSKPIVCLTSSMVALADGDLSVEIKGCERQDELGKMARAVQVFKNCALEKEKMEAEKKELAKKAQAEKIAMMNEMAENFDSSIGSIITRVSSASNEMNATASQMSSTASQTSEQSTVVSSAAMEASANVQTVASATEELSSSITEITRQVMKSNDVAKTAAQTALDTIETVQELHLAAQAVGEVISLINEIAEQTNMLALNATIEAARAGESGKGFAVVATEVKNLSEQTSKATSEITQRITKIQNSTGDAVHAMRSIGKTIDEVNSISSAISAAVEEQGAATQEIARNIQEAAQGTELVTQNITQVSSGANDTGAASEQVLQAASELSEQSEFLKEEVQNFLSTIRAA